jgi:hypothetical protein
LLGIILALVILVVAWFFIFGVGSPDGHAPVPVELDEEYGNIEYD